MKRPEHQPAISYNQRSQLPLQRVLLLLIMRGEEVEEGTNPSTHQQPQQQVKLTIRQLLLLLPLHCLPSIGVSLSHRLASVVVLSVLYVSEPTYSFSYLLVPFLLMILYTASNQTHTISSP